MKYGATILEDEKLTLRKAWFDAQKREEKRE